jgi:hypothetical protein
MIGNIDALQLLLRRLRYAIIFCVFYSIQYILANIYQRFAVVFSAFDYIYDLLLEGHQFSWQLGTICNDSTIAFGDLYDGKMISSN